MREGASLTVLKVGIGIPDWSLRRSSWFTFGNSLVMEAVGPPMRSEGEGTRTPRDL